LESAIVIDEQAVLKYECVGCFAELLITEVYVNGTAGSRGSMRVDQLPSCEGRGSYFFG